MHIFKSKPTKVFAVVLILPTKVPTLSGEVLGLPGEWLVVDKYGNKYVCQDETFRDLYLPENEDAERYFDKVKPTIH